MTGGWLQEVVMISKCANPECSRPFRYFREGVIFAVEPHQESYTRFAPGHSDYGSQKCKTEFFWLCADCSGHFTLSCRRANGTAKPVLEPLASRPRRHF